MSFSRKARRAKSRQTVVARRQQRRRLKRETERELMHRRTELALAALRETYGDGAAPDAPDAADG